MVSGGRLPPCQPPVAAAPPALPPLTPGSSLALLLEILRLLQKLLPGMNSSLTPVKDP